MRVANRLVISFALMAGCSQETSVSPPPPDTTGGGGTVQKATLTLRAVVESQDTSIASRIGSPGGFLRAAQVTIERRGSTGTSKTATTDATGSVRFTELLPGDYSISAIRVLSANELAALDSGDADVTAFGGGASVTVAAPSTSANLTIVAGRRGSLVISELFSGQPRTADGGSYFLAHFIELHNNSDTTIYLDGKVIVRDQSWHRDYSSPLSCTEMQRWRNDPDGIWTAFIYAFPGTGRTNPLPPGGTVVVATDAVDHRPFVSVAPDLSLAQFEFIGPSDVDNPASPNMVNVGLRDWAASVIGHGLSFESISNAFLIADSVDIASLPRDNLPVVNPQFVRIPAERILDVFSSWLRPELEVGINSRCSEIVNAKFDRQSGAFIGEDATYGIQRRVFATLPDGRKILQRTKTSARDFQMLSPFTPSTIP